MTRPKAPASRWSTVSLCYRIATVPYDTCSLIPTGHWGCGGTQCWTLPRQTTKGRRTRPVMPGCHSRARLLSLLFLGPPGLPPQSTPLRRLPLQLSLLPPSPASPALRPPPHPQEPPHQPQNLKSLQVVVVSLQGDGAGGFVWVPLPTSPSPAPESVGTEEPPEDGEPDAAELRRRRLQKLESPVAH